MSRRSLALALAALMIVAAVVILVPAAPTAPHASERTSVAFTPTQSHNAVGPIYYYLYNGYGDYVYNTFYPGEIGWGTLNFYIDDAVDHEVNVTLTDPNASRDGVPSPAWKVTVHVNDSLGYYYSGAAGISYTFPTLKYGGTWVINFTGSSTDYIQGNITLKTYYLDASSTAGLPASVLPGESFSVFWWAYLDSNGATLYTGATSVWISGHYRSDGKVVNLFPTGAVQVSTGGWGVWNGTVPLNATGDSQIRVEVYAITTVAGLQAENESTNTSVYVGHLAVYDYGITPFPAYCVGSYYTFIPAGSQVAACIELTSTYGADSTPVSGITVKVNYWNGTKNVTPTGGAPTSVTTGSNGVASVFFDVSSPPFQTEFNYPYDGNTVNFTATVPGANSTVTQWTVWENLSGWYVDDFNWYQSGIVNIALDHTEYYPGSTATATWSIATSNSTVTGAITANTWIVYQEDSGVVYAAGTFTGSAQSGTFTFPITSAMVGNELDVEILASNSTTQFYGDAYATVVAPTILLSPSSGYYTAGSTEAVTAVLSGSTVAGATITWQAYAEYDDYDTESYLGSGTVASGGTFDLKVSSTDPPQEISVEAYAASGNTLIASGGTEMQLETGYSVLLGVTTVSNYADGSFQPGQTVTLSYQVLPIDGTAMPQTFSFELYAQGYPYYQYLENVAPSGTTSFTIPSGAPAGALTLNLIVTAGLTAGACAPVNECSGTTSVTVNPSPSVLEMELGAGSGLTVGWLILLLLLILVAIVLFLVLRRRGGSSASSAPPVSPSTPMSSPAPPPSTPPAAEWQHPSSTSGDSQPPLPPPGASS
jgi:hypothetical protein